MFETNIESLFYSFLGKELEDGDLVGFSISLSLFLAIVTFLGSICAIYLPFSCSIGIFNIFYCFSYLNSFNYFTFASS
jgi:hypothetical protein